MQNTIHNFAAIGTGAVLCDISNITTPHAGGLIGLLTIALHVVNTILINRKNKRDAKRAEREQAASMANNTSAAGLVPATN